MCSYADDFFQNECSAGVGAFGIEMMTVVDPETGKTIEVFDPNASTKKCGSSTLPGH